MISSAQIAIDTAKTAVTEQSKKEYVITITDESRIKMNVGQTVSLLQEDLRTTLKTINEAKKAVHLAASALAKITEINKVGTKSANTE